MVQRMFARLKFVQMAAQIPRLTGRKLLNGRGYCDGMPSFTVMDKNPVVTVKEGKLRGTVGTLLDGGSYYAFKGVPYATPPVGDLRFRAPLPPKSWSGERDATTHGAVCPQYDMNTMQVVSGSEDCLYLNVYSKNLAAKSPVMVFIHGGGFMSGSGDDNQYGPQFLIKHGVVLVTINYRLEVFGFLALDTPVVPGNAGMKDQVLALKWVKENIGKFGGDAGNVTIFGESAGAVSVSYHIVSPMSRGLFHRAIVQSGTCLQDWAVASEPKTRAFRIGKLLGKETNDTQELLQFLRSVPAEDLVKMTFKTATTDEKQRTGLPIHFVPNIEKKFDGVEGFITENPIDTMLAKNFSKIPLMIGYTSAEGMLILETLLRKAEILNSNPSLLVPREISEKVPEKKVKEFGERILKFYTKDEGFNENAASSLVDFATDVHFGYQTHRLVRFYASNVPIYMYRFDYDTDLNVIKNLLGLGNMKGACHADDLFYLFCGMLNKELYEEREDLRSIVDGLTKMWTDFAGTGNPTPGPSSPQWVPYTPLYGDYLLLGEVMMMRKRGDQERMEFWNKLYCDAGLPCIKKSGL